MSLLYRQSIALSLFAVFAAGCQERALSPGEAGNSSADLRAVDMRVGPGVADLGGPVVDLATPTGDLSGLGGVACGMETCGPGALCCLSQVGQGFTAMCTTQSVCPGGAIPATCDGPEDCTFETPTCCVALSLGGGGMGGGQPMGGATCTASCPAAVTFGGPGGGGGKIATQLCHSAADCVGYAGEAPILGMTSFEACCGLPGVSFQFCAPGLLASLGGGVTCN